MDLSIIIINFNTQTITCDCLHSLAQNLDTQFTYEVILVDNAAQISNEVLFKSVIPQLIYLKLETNVGFGVANNKGMSIARGRFFLLLNSDTIVLDKSIQKSLAFMELPENMRIGLLGCRLLNEDGSYQASFYPAIKRNLLFYFLSNNPFLYKLFRIKRSYAEPEIPSQVGDVAGAFMLLRREVFDRTQGFDPDFFLYCEETEWCRNRISKDYQVFYYPEASIVHLGGKSAPGALMYIQSQLSLALYWYKTGFMSYILHIIFCYLNCVFFALQYPFTDVSGRENIRKYIGSFFHIQPYLFFNIPAFQAKYHSRKEPLILKEARLIFFKNE